MPAEPKKASQFLKALRERIEKKEKEFLEIQSELTTKGAELTHTGAEQEKQHTRTDLNAVRHDIDVLERLRGILEHDAIEENGAMLEALDTIIEEQVNEKKVSTIKAMALSCLFGILVGAVAVIETLNSLGHQIVLQQLAPGTYIPPLP
jgi:hypothetical protein